MKTYLVCQFETSRIQLLNHFQMHLFQRFGLLTMLTQVFINRFTKTMKITALHYFDRFNDTFVDIYLNHHCNVVESASVVFFLFNCSSFLKRFFSVFATACWCIQFCPLTGFWFWIFYYVMLIVLFLVYRSMRGLMDVGGGGLAKTEKIPGGWRNGKNPLNELTKVLVG